MSELSEGESECKFGDPLPPLPRPKFTVIVVKKRINARIFLDTRGGADNPPPGTVVDKEITKPEW